MLYFLKGEAIDEQLNAHGVNTSELDYVVITGKDGKFVLLTSDNAYSQWIGKFLYCRPFMQTEKKQLKSLEWIQETSMDSNCVESLSTHEPNVEPHIVELDM